MQALKELGPQSGRAAACETRQPAAEDHPGDRRSRGPAGIGCGLDCRRRTASGSSIRPYLRDAPAFEHGVASTASATPWWRRSRLAPIPPTSRCLLTALVLTSNQGSDTVSVIDTATNTVVATVSVETLPSL